jgi:peptide/nickel transport system substrate-binding protein
MKKMLVIILAFSVSSILYDESFAEKNTFFDSVKFIQYLDENTALEEVRNGNLDIYYFTISPDRLESDQNRNELQVFDSTGGIVF